ncbi:hypothetical protein EVG20_g6296 [Dentipellis fragilis]|uniref:RBR-type E3 ubiquitin transferase n=1 Tax=Dentipellis fragilis TaxID=205917 RepID=A0A4Y9YR15_9AGAM|nr:hypothetical protein EVG20_g6296 [Dentipellis fragilis]
MQRERPDPAGATFQPPRNIRRHPQRGPEVCRKFLNGICRNNPCPRIHPPREGEAVALVATDAKDHKANDTAEKPANPQQEGKPSVKLPDVPRPIEPAKTAPSQVPVVGVPEVAVSLPPPPPPSMQVSVNRPVRPEGPLIQINGPATRAFTPHGRIRTWTGPGLDSQNRPVLLRQEPVPGVPHGMMAPTVAYQNGTQKVFDEKRELAHLALPQMGMPVAVNFPQRPLAQGPPRQVGHICDDLLSPSYTDLAHPALRQYVAPFEQCNQSQVWAAATDHSRSDSNTTTTASRSDSEIRVFDGNPDRKAALTDSSPSSPEAPKIQASGPSASQSLMPPVPFGVCLNWALGKCWRTQCRWRHYGYDPRLPRPPQQRPADSAEPQISGGQSDISADTVKAHSAQTEESPSQPHKMPEAAPGRTIGKSTANGASPPSHPQRHPPLYSLPVHNRPRPAGPPPPIPMAINVLERVRVAFGPGFDVQRIMTAFDTLWIRISNVPVDLPQEKIEHFVKPFGTVLEIQRHGNDYDDERQTVSVKMSSPTEASAAAESLDNVEVWGGRIRVRLSLGKTAQNRVMCDTDVHVMWQAPLKGAYAGYMTKEAAEKAVARMDGLIMTSSRKKTTYFITASLHKGEPCLGPFNVRFWGLPLTTKESVIDKLGKNTGYMWKTPTFKPQKFGAETVESILKQIGKMSPMVVSPPPYKDGMVHAWVRYETPDIAKTACELNGLPQERMKQEKLYVQRIHSVMHTVPWDVYNIIAGGIERLRLDMWKISRETNISIKKADDKSSVMVKLVSQDKKTLVQVKSKLNLLIHGELLQADGVQLWDGFFTSASMATIIRDQEHWHPVLIRVDKVRRTVRLIGHPDNCRLVRAHILDKLVEFRGRKVHTIDLSGRMIGLFMNGDLKALQNAHGPENVWLDLTQRVICVRESPDKPSVYEAVQKAFRRAQQRHPSERGQLTVDPCPVCFEDPTRPVMLGCSHVFCAPCLERYLQSAIDTRRFPLTCLGAEGTCGAPISLYTARDVLTPDDFQALARAAFHAHVQARPDAFHYCPTPDCAQVYRPGPRDTVLACPDCLTAICPHCACEYHEGVTCLDRGDWNRWRRGGVGGDA